MSLLLLFHPRVVDTTRGAFSSDGVGTFATAGAALAAADAASDGTGVFLATGQSTSAAAVSISGVADLQAVGQSTGSAVVVMDGVGDLQAVGAFEGVAGGDVASDGVSNMLVVGAALSAVDPALALILKGARPEKSPWKTRREIVKIEIEEDLEDLTAFAVMAASQLARDYVARCGR